MKKVLMITNRFIFGGIEQLLLTIFENSYDKDIHYDVLTLISEKDMALVKRIYLSGAGYYSLELDKHHSWLERQFFHYKELYRFIKDNRYDVVHLNITSYVRALDMLMIKATGVPVRIIHAHSANVRDSLSRKILKPIRNMYDFTATHFFACSDQAANYLFSKYVNDKHRYMIVANGIKIDNYKYSSHNREEYRKKLGLNENTVYGHVGRFTEAKNHTFLIDVFYEINALDPNSRLLLVGDGEEKDVIITKINALGLSECVILLGSSSEVPFLLSAMDVFLFPSKWEGLGLSVIEAQCNGLPCYVSENVPEAACVTSNVRRLNSKDGAKDWADYIVSNNNSRVEEITEIQKAGYDILNTISQIEGIYKNM